MIVSVEGVWLHPHKIICYKPVFMDFDLGEMIFRWDGISWLADIIIEAWLDWGMFNKTS